MATRTTTSKSFDEVIERIERLRPKMLAGGKGFVLVLDDKGWRAQRVLKGLLQIHKQ